MTKKKTFLLLEPPINTHTLRHTKRCTGCTRVDTRGDCGVTSKWNQNKIKPLKKRREEEKRKSGDRRSGGCGSFLVVIVVFCAIEAQPQSSKSYLYVRTFFPFKKEKKGRAKSNGRNVFQYFVGSKYKGRDRLGGGGGTCATRFRDFRQGAF